MHIDSQRFFLCQGNLTFLILGMVRIPIVLFVLIIAIKHVIRVIFIVVVIRATSIQWYRVRPISSSRDKRCSYIPLQAAFDSATNVNKYGAIVVPGT